ncbi:hypothetical protein F53441_14560 [Fusarium austroafricanum]|uniref:Fumarylacetoacetase-like C-terminal domain-containing protein n=1 Tax=Fusarium austroafricanum TaxID=2364996 RepID=A0A8H4N9B5_9HYPO|nr:hypothetical protein F53441_14560 [Fusarium austroafricanum]
MLQPGDAIATGTPAGLGIGKNPPVFLEPGDEIPDSVTGLGTLPNRIGTTDTLNATVQRVFSSSLFHITNSAKSFGSGIRLTDFNGKKLNYRKQGSGSNQIVFVHDLGGTLDYWAR